MSLPRFSVARPIFTSMVTLIVVLLGLVAFFRLRIDLLPAIEMPTLTVMTEYENASPEVVERLVTQIIEEVLATVPGIEQMTSISSEGMSNVEVRFVWGTDLDAGVADVRSRLEDELSELPEDINRPQIRKFDIASFPVVIIGIASALDPVELTELIDKQVRSRFARVPGVAQADLFGGFEREIRVALDPARLKALGLPLDTVLAALRDANLDRPAGAIEQGRYEVILRAPGEFGDLDTLRRTVVAVRDGAAIELRQIAEVRDTYQRLTRIIRVDGQPGLRIGIRKQANANTVQVSQAVLAEIDAINRALPQIHVVAVINQGNFIERSIANVARSVLYGGALAVLVLLFFLRNVRSTVVIALAIPISIVATLALMYLGGFTLNLMTLGGLALGVGMMVDNSIVVLENVFRRRAEHAEAPVEAAVTGAGEVAGAIVASTLTTLVIFLPLVFVRGISGLLFVELAYVIVLSLLASLLVALSLVPMLASKLLRPHAERTATTQRLDAAAERAFHRLEAAYARLLQRALQHRTLTLGGAALLLLASLLLVPLIGTEFLPPSDEGEVRVSGEMEVGTRLSLIDQQSKVMERIVVPTVPEIDAYVVSVGASGRRPDDASKAEIQMSLRPATERTRSNTAIAADLRKRLEGRVAGMTIRTRAPQGQFVLERVLAVDDGLTVEVRGFDLATLDTLAARVAAALDGVPGITDIDVTRKAGVPQAQMRIDRDKAADLGLSVRDVADALAIAVGGREAGDYRTQGNSHRILVQLADAERLSLDEILDLTLSTRPTSSGEAAIALRNVVRVEPGRGPLLIDRKDQQRLVTVKANVADRDMGSVARDVQTRLDAIARPAGYDLHIAGTFEQQEEAFNELLISLVLALLLVYMVLACQYESLRDPVVVMASVPLAAIGVLVTLFATDTTLNVQSAIGCIMLGGIVVNNAILLVDQAGRLRAEEGMTTRAALAEAGRRRLRPILMTTLTTLLGLLPLALGIGEGADAQAPLARAVIGGLTASTLITLVVVPVVYTLFHPERD
ncbi:MAG: efflux RND transporter permease subunit [Myxococcales bacterium]|nr:efflux RND transporter permease subunit [Myxococcales bacterium]